MGIDDKCGNDQGFDDNGDDKTLIRKFAFTLSLLKRKMVINALPPLITPITLNTSAFCKPPCSETDNDEGDGGTLLFDLIGSCCHLLFFLK